MSKVWIIVADDMSAAKVAGVAASTNEEVEAVVLGSRERSEYVATLGVSTVFWYDTTNTLAESYAGAIADAALAAEVDAIVAADEAVARVITGCIAAKGNVLITSNVNALRVEGDQVTIERGVAEGSSIQTLKAQRPAIALIGESVDEIDPGNEPASIQQIEVSVPDALTAGDYHAPEDRKFIFLQPRPMVSLIRN